MNKNIKYLIEHIQLFNPIDYNDEDIMDNQEIKDMLGYKYFPKTLDELKKLVVNRIKENPEKPYLSDIDTSKITDMSGLFMHGQCTDNITKDLIGNEYFYKYRVVNNIKILDLSAWDTSNVENMRYMFRDCEKVESINLSSFDTSNVKNMSFMFMDCLNLKTLDLSSFDTSNVRNMHDMFGGCKTLTELELSNFNTSKVNNMLHMFGHCMSLKKLDLSSFNTRNVTNMSHMFIYDNSLESLNISSFNTCNVTLMDHMFTGCESLKELDLSNFNTSKITHMTQMFTMCKNLKTLNISSFNTSRVVDMSNMFYGCESLEYLDLSNFDMSNVRNISEMFAYCMNLDDLTIDMDDLRDDVISKMVFHWCPDYIIDKFKPYIYDKYIIEHIQRFNPIDYEDNDIGQDETNKVLYRYFPETTEELKEILENKIINRTSNYFVNFNDIDVSRITDFSYLFYGLNPEERDRNIPPGNKPVKFDFSTWDVSNGKYFRGMFKECSNITADFSNWDVSNGLDFEYMFYNAKNIRGDFRHWDLSNALRFNQMFFNCLSIKFDYTKYKESPHAYFPKTKNELQTLIDKFYNNHEYNYNVIDVSRITDFSYLFSNKDLLYNIKIDKWDVSNGRNFSNMFSICNGFDADLSNWDVSNGINFMSMFGCCYAFNSDLSRWNVSKGENFANMFYCCHSLETDFSNWDLSSVNINLPSIQTIDNMFKDVSKKSKLPKMYLEFKEQYAKGRELLPF